MTLDDPIAAPASAPGGGVRAVVRLSGAGCAAALRTRFTPDDPARWASARTATHHRGSLDLADFPVPVPCGVLLWPARDDGTARSYTGQPSAEVHLPGSPPVVEATLAALHAAGVRPARPGEFTLRAFLAGRVDLAQAEAVLGVIDAADGEELRTALDQLAGGLSTRLGAVRADLLDLLADLEAGLDFVDEGIEFVTREEIRRRTAAARVAIDDLLADAGRRTRTGTRPRVVLAGPPNAGKSTLFNALLGDDAAIVSDVAGTTRDALTAETTCGGLPVELVDTAGEEAATDAISADAQTHRAARVRDADLVLWCVPAGAGDVAVPGGVLHVETKCDAGGTRDEGRELRQGVERGERRARSDTVTQLSSLVPRPHPVSAHTGTGLDELRTLIAAHLADAPPSRHLVGGTAARGRACFTAASDALGRADDAIDLGEEFAAAEVRTAVDALGEVLGEVYTDDLLDRIFSRFCIGK